MATGVGVMCIRGTTNRYAVEPNGETIVEQLRGSDPELDRIARYSPRTLMDDNKTISGCNMGHLFGELAMLAEQFEALVALYEAGHIHPHVDRSFTFSEAAAAHHYLHDRKSKGKVLLVPDAIAA